MFYKIKKYTNIFLFQRFKNKLAYLNIKKNIKKKLREMQKSNGG